MVSKGINLPGAKWPLVVIYTSIFQLINSIYNFDFYTLIIIFLLDVNFAFECVLITVIFPFLKYIQNICSLLTFQQNNENILFIASTYYIYQNLIYANIYIYMYKCCFVIYYYIMNLFLIIIIFSVYCYYYYHILRLATKVRSGIWEMLGPLRH